jgi:hypothetical protein
MARRSMERSFQNATRTHGTKSDVLWNEQFTWHLPTLHEPYPGTMVYQIWMKER